MSATHELDPTTVAAAAECFVARQPIFDRSLNVIGYELLFRGSEELLHGTGDEAKTADVLAITIDLGIEILANGKPAFVNFPAWLLERDLATLFSPESLAIEVLETVEPTPATLAALQRLGDAGYSIVFDDLEFGGPWEDHLDLADIVKVDFCASCPSERLLFLSRNRERKFQLLAEKVETLGEFQEALKQGFTAFQGYFFCKPQTVSVEKIEGFRENHIKLLAEARKPDPDLNKISTIIKTDVSLSVRLIRFINSAGFGWQKKISSVRHALSLLGYRELRRWVTLVTMSAVLRDYPSETLVQCVTRALFCEQLAEQLGRREDGLDFYMVGLFSSLDTVLGRSMEDVIQDIPLEEDIEAALLGEPGALRETLDLAIAYEKGDWAKVPDKVQGLGLATSAVPRCYLDAVSIGSKACS